MQSDVWYDLAVRELSAGTDAAKELLRQAQAARPPTPPPADEPADEER